MGAVLANTRGHRAKVLQFFIFNLGAFTALRAVNRAFRGSAAAPAAARLNPSNPLRAGGRGIFPYIGAAA
jgi:hypothetical protein